MIASLDTAALQQRFALEWASAEPATPVFWDNEPVDAPPDDGHWLRFVVAPSQVRRVGFTRGGQVRMEGRGRVEIQVFAPRSTGTAERDRLADAAAMIFREWKSADGRIECSGADIFATPPDEADRWSMRRVSIPYLSRRFV